MAHAAFPEQDTAGPHNHRSIGAAEYQSARAALAQGRIGRAAGLAREALAEFASHAERPGIADGLENLAAVAAARSDPGRAAALAGAAAAIRETIAASQLPDLVITSRLLREADQSGEQIRPSRLPAMPGKTP